MLSAFLALNNRLFANPFNKGVAHIRKGGVGIKPSFGFHFLYIVFYCFKLVLVELYFFGKGHIPLNKLCGRKAWRDAYTLCVVLNHMGNRMNTAVNRARCAEILHLRFNLSLGGCNRSFYKLAYTVVLSGAYGYCGYT